MNKNIKKVIAIALTVSAFSAIAPVTDFNLLTTKVYAANTEKYLDSLTLSTSDGDDIKLYGSNEYKNNERVLSEDVEADEIYYARTSSGTVNVEIDGPSTRYVRVFKGTSDSATGKKVGADMKIEKNLITKTIIVVKVYGDDPGDDVEYDDDSTYNLLSTYKIKVEYTGSENNTTEDPASYDPIYLEKLSVNGQNIVIGKSNTKYTFDVSSDVDEAVIRATPENDDYSVLIDNSYVDDDDKYKKTVDLNKGENKFEIEIQDKDKEDRIYTLVINRGAVSSGSNKTDTPETPNTTTDVSKIKTNQWVQVNGKWQYIDATGNAVKDTWVQNYYVQADGNMAIGWLSYGGSWYYLGVDGAKKTGWQSINGSWYYLNTSEGKMQTGWIKDINGKYYYLNNNGSMAYNTTIGGYKLGPSGAWYK